MHIKKLCYGLVLMLALATPVLATPTIGGTTGLIMVPSAEALQYKEYNFGVDSISQSNGKSSLFYKFNLGAFKNMELGFVGGSVPTEGVFVNVKYHLMAEESRYPLSLALGIQNLSSHSLTDVYMVASKKFPNFQGHFGFKANFGESEVNATVMAGLEYLMTNQLSLIGDINGNKKVYQVNTGVRYVFSDFPDFAVRAAFTDLSNSLGYGTGFTIGVSYSQFM
ncbi:MAG: hypothetical protein AB7F28_02165 [Candidatus Margulisiibacteriota bacterium]